METTHPTADGVVTVTSRFKLEETLCRLQEAFLSHDLTVFAHFDHGAGARDVGLQMQPAHVLVFGNPRAGTPLMVASPLVALDLPLKVLVWEDALESVNVSFTTSAHMAHRYGLPADLTANIAGAETLITNTVSE